MILRIRFPTESDNLKLSLPKNKYLLWLDNVVSPKQLHDSPILRQEKIQARLVAGIK